MEAMIATSLNLYYISPHNFMTHIRSLMNFAYGN